jgi:hypothetical protein
MKSSGLIGGTSHFTRALTVCFKTMGTVPATTAASKRLQKGSTMRAQRSATPLSSVRLSTLIPSHSPCTHTTTSMRLEISCSSACRNEPPAERTAPPFTRVSMDGFSAPMLAPSPEVGPKKASFGLLVLLTPPPELRLNS